MQNGASQILFRSWKELSDLQNRKLRHFITRQLYPYSAYYRRLFDERKIRPSSIRSVEDLRRIPLTSKKDFFDASGKDPRSRNLDFVLQPSEELARKHLPKTELLKFLIPMLTKGKGGIRRSMEDEYSPLFLTATAGTTGLPVPFLYTVHDIENLKIYGKRIIEVFGIGRGEKGVNVFPYAPHLAFWQTVFAGFSSRMFILSTGGGRTLGTEGNIQSIMRVKPHFLIGVACYVYHILKTARDEGLKMDFINKIVLGASRVPRGFKVKIFKMLSDMGASDIKILGTYGFTESRAAWPECPTDIHTSSGYHTCPDREVFEIIDPDTGEVKKEGEDGEIVYSGIDACGTCVLRYRTGDLVRGGIVYSPCPHCGRTVPRISSDIARVSNIKNFQFSKIKGSLVNLNTLEHALDDHEEIDQWQIEIAKKNNDPYEVDELILYVCLLRDIDRDELARRLTEEVFLRAEVSFNRIAFVSRKEILERLEIESSVKARKIADRRPAA